MKSVLKPITRILKCQGGSTPVETITLIAIMGVMAVVTVAILSS